MATRPDAHAYENPRPEVAAMVPAGRRRILDLGCSSGALGAALKARDGCEVVGVERDPLFAERAAQRLDRVVVADLDAPLPDDLGTFDCLIAADVLEHLRDPWGVLAQAVTRVEPGGYVVVSLPNIRHWSALWTIARHGTFPRAAQGIFDATHLRWFTLADAIGLLEQAGVEHEAVHRQLRLGSHYHDVRDRRIAWLRRTPLRAFLTYQNVLRGRRR
ncbi:MAG TPA: class I SAM-dependent methyltransferase [Solirubrobacteraceae bacterium]